MRLSDPDYYPTFIRKADLLFYKNGNLSLSYIGDGMGGSDIPRFVLGGANHGFHSGPKTGQKMLVLHEQRGYPALVLPMIEYPYPTSPLFPNPTQGESYQAHSDGRIADYMQGSGNTIIFSSAYGTIGSVGTYSITTNGGFLIVQGMTGIQLMGHISLSRPALSGIGGYIWPVAVVAAGAQAGAGATFATLKSHGGATDNRGYVQVTTGTGSTAGELLVMTFAASYSAYGDGAGPFAVVVARDAATAALGVWCKTTATTLSIMCLNAPTDATAYHFAYVVFD